MSLILLNIIGFITLHARYFVIAGAIILLTVTVGLTSRYCRKEATLNEKQIEKNQAAIASGEHDKLVEALVESKVATKQIDDDRANAKAEKVNAFAEAKKQSEGMSNEELAAELEKLK